MPEIETIGGFPVNVSPPYKQGQVLMLSVTETTGEPPVGEWINVNSTDLEISVCGKITSPDHTPQGGDALVFNEDDQHWQPE